MPDHADRTHLSNIINANNNELYSTSTNNFPYNVRHVKKEGRWPLLLQMDAVTNNCNDINNKIGVTILQKF